MGKKRGSGIKPTLMDWTIKVLLDEQRKNKTEITVDVLLQKLAMQGIKKSKKELTKDEISSFKGHMSKVFSELEECEWIDIEYRKPKSRGNIGHYCKLRCDIRVFKEIATKLLNADDDSIYRFMDSEYKKRMVIPLLSELLDKLGLEHGIQIRSLNPIDYEIKDDFLKAGDFLSEIMDAITVSPTFLDLVVQGKIDKNLTVRIGKVIQPMLIIPAMRPYLSSIDSGAANYFLDEAEKIVRSLKASGNKTGTDVSTERVKTGLRFIALNSILSDLIKYPDYEKHLLDYLIKSLNSESIELEIIAGIKNSNIKNE